MKVVKRRANADAITKEQVLINLIEDEWAAIRLYQSVRPLLAGDEQAIIDDIVAEEKVHIGQLQHILDMIGTATTEKIDEGVKEAQDLEGLGTPIMMEEPVAPDLIASRVKRVKRNVKASFESVIDEGKVTEQEVREAFALGFVDQSGVEIDEDLDVGEEIDGETKDEIIQYAYDLGVEKAKELDEGEDNFTDEMYDDDLDDDLLDDEE